QLGHGSEYLLGGGCYPRPDNEGFLMPGGFVNGDRIEPFDHRLVREHTRYSWFVDHGPTHPWDSVTIAEHGQERGQYSHTKATRYADQVVQLGPMVDLYLAGDPLIATWMQAEGPNTWPWYGPPKCPMRRKDLAWSMRHEEHSAIGSASATAKSPIIKSSRPQPGTHHRATPTAGGDTGRKASLG